MIIDGRKIPIGIQTFQDIRTQGYVYVDKTALVYRLANEGKSYFLGRPRRFGKSLLLSTLKAYFLGQKELFEGLAIAELETEWVKHPVFQIDLTGENYTGLAALEECLAGNLQPLEAQWGRKPDETSASVRFKGLIRRACEQSKQQVVVLIDEYDKPLLETMDDPELNEAIRNELKAFYGVLKGSDPYLRFVMLTGVTKFSKVSVFSDLNHLRDISMEEGYEEICGISEAELVRDFAPELHALAKKQNMSYKKTVGKMRKMYDGYHFQKGGTGMFNPFSVLNTLAKYEFGYYWFQTGTPTLLINLLKKADFDLLQFNEGVTISARSIDDYRAESGNITPILYQSGYLTIKDYNPRRALYTLGFPNEEVQYGFLEELLPAYLPYIKDDQGMSNEALEKKLRYYKIKRLEKLAVPAWQIT